jgi:hypothetical protein
VDEEGLAEYEEDVLLLANLNDVHREPTKEKREEKNTQRCMEHISKGHVVWSTIY